MPQRDSSQPDHTLPRQTLNSHQLGTGNKLSPFEEAAAEALFDHSHNAKSLSTVKPRPGSSFPWPG